MIHVVGKNLAREELLSELLECDEVVGLDTETTGIDPRKQPASGHWGHISCWSVSCEKYQKVFLWADQLEYFKPWLENPKCKKVGHNIFGFDYHMFAKHGIALQGIAGDTMYMSRLLYCSKERSHGLKDLMKNRLGIEQPSFVSLFSRPAHKLEYVQQGRRIRGEFTPMDYVETRRKVGEHRGVPTLMASGEFGFIYKKLEQIPLEEIPAMYPDRLENLYDYASLDAYGTRLLYARFTAELERYETVVSK